MIDEAPGIPVRGTISCLDTATTHEGGATVPGQAMADAIGGDALLVSSQDGRRIAVVVGGGANLADMAVMIARNGYEATIVPWDDTMSGPEPDIVVGVPTCSGGLTEMPGRHLFERMSHQDLAGLRAVAGAPDLADLDAFCVGTLVRVRDNSWDGGKPTMKEWRRSMKGGGRR